MFIFIRRKTENTNAICEKTAGLRSGNFLDLNSACSKMLVTVKILQFHDMLNENRFLGIFLGHGKRPASNYDNMAGNLNINFYTKTCLLIGQKLVKQTRKYSKWVD